MPGRSTAPALIALAIQLTRCAPVDRPWRGAEPDASMRADASTRDDASPASLTWIDPRGPEASGCDGPAEVARVREAWALAQRLFEDVDGALLGCLRQQTVSPATNGFAEEIVARLRAAMPTRLGCEARPGAPDAHGQARLSERALYLGHDLLATRSAPRVAGAIAHALLHTQNYEHHSGARGEYFYSAFSQVDRCVRQVAGERDLGELPPTQPRDRMRVEAELQPFGQTGGTQLPFFHLECPPGSRAAGYGASLDRGQDPPRVRGYGLICVSSTGVETARRSVGDIERWTRCGADERVVGVQGYATNGYIFDATPTCEAPSRRGASPAPATPPAGGARDAHRIERRCPPGQAVIGLSGIANSQAVRQMTFICRDTAVGDIGTHRELAPIGLPVTGLGARIGLGRCSDQGVMVGLFGHVTPSTRDILRLGGVCRGTAWDGDRLWFRREGGALVPEHVVPAMGGVPADQSPDAPSFEDLATNENAGRCPDAMSLVGVRLRFDDDARVPRNLQGLCADLDAWAHGLPTTLATVTATGVWAHVPETALEERRCEPGEFLVGLRAERTPLVLDGILPDRIERFALVCRSLRVVP